MSKKPVVLMILDGYGLNDKVEGNAVREANTPVMDRLMKEYPFVRGNASGMARAGEHRRVSAYRQVCGSNNPAPFLVAHQPE